MTALGRDLVNTLYWGENLEVLRRFISDESVDLVYLDPPFNKNRAYSLIFRDESGRTSDAQLATFDDYWHWGPTPARHYDFLTNSSEHRGAIPAAVSNVISSLHSFIGPSPLLAYLVEMTTRLTELHRVLTPTGSLYLHCDPTASHYLRVILDAIFGPRNFRNEIAWKRTHSHGDSRRAFPNLGDRLLFYTRSDKFTFNRQHVPYTAEYVRERYRYQDADGRRYQLVTLRSPNPRPNLVYDYNGYRPHANGWAVSREKMEQLDREGRLYFPDNPNGALREKYYLDEMPGVLAGDIWTDIGPISSAAKERLGYPTQKPIALLNRVIEASSNPGDVVLDPFCGCGTGIEAAVTLDRRWIGIDHSNFAVEVIRKRMLGLGVDLSVFDWPPEVDGVRRMVEASGGRHRFEAWALVRLGAQPVRELGGKGADQGIDGRIGFTLPSGRVETIIVSVKSGHVSSAAIRDLKGTVQREHAALGLLFTLQEPTDPMRREAATAGFYRSPIDGSQFPRIVIHTVRDLLEDGRLPDLPSRLGTQEGLWQLPTASSAVQLRGTARNTASRRATAMVPPVSIELERVRRDLAASPGGPGSPRKSTRDRPAPLPSRGSADTT